MYIDILLLALVAGVIFVKLYNILGTENEADDIANIKSAIQQAAEVQKKKQIDREEQALIDSLPQIHAQKILKIKELSPDFHYGKFLTAVESAFEAIIKAFKEYDLDALEFLTDGEAKENFLNNIKNLKEKGKQLNIDIVSVKEKVIEEIKISRTDAKITVGFKTEQIFYTKDKDGNVIAGDIHKVEEIADSWVFAKQLNNSSPVWKLVATSS